MSIQRDSSPDTFGVNNESADAPAGDAAASEGAPRGTILVDARPLTPSAEPKGEEARAPSLTPDSLRGDYEVRGGQVVADKYRIERALGEGGMGRVYVAEHIQLGIQVAVKVMQLRFVGDDAYFQRFRREARAAARVGHPNVVRILDFGIHLKQPYLVMDLLKGDSLDVWLRRRAALPSIAVVCSLLGQLLSAVGALHQAGVVHRDLKPSNMMVLRERDSLQLKVLDLGLARFDDSGEIGPRLTAPDVVAGTPEYMSPEQGRSLQVGPSSNLYAVGCVLTELLQGQPPFVAEAAVDVISQHMYSPAPGLFRPAAAEVVPAGLESLRLQLLQKHPSRRPESAQRALDLLRQALDESALPGAVLERRSSMPPAARQDRIPAWNARSETERENEPEPVSQAQRVIVVPRRADSCLGIELRTGLQMHGYLVEVLRDADEHSEPTVIADAIYLVEALDVKDEQAASTLRRLAGLGVDVIVCGPDIGAQQVSNWIEVGASDAVAAPLSADGLVNKLTRLTRRRVREKRRAISPAG